jgi:hypothetical protein
MKKLSIAMLCVFILGSICGCAPFLLTLGAAGTAAVSIDTVRLERNNMDSDTAWKAAIAVLEEQKANITKQDQENKIIQAMVKESNITINISQIDAKKTAIDITSRRKGIPDIKTADRLFDQINAQLRVKPIVSGS